MFVSCGTFAYSFNEIGLILNELNEKSDVFLKEMRLISRFRYLLMKIIYKCICLNINRFL